MLCSIYAFLVQTQAETRAQAFDPEPLCSLSSSSSFPKLSQWLSSQRSSDYDSWWFSSHRCTRSIRLILIFKAFVVVSLRFFGNGSGILSKGFSCFEARLVLYSHISHLYRNSHYLLAFKSVQTQMLLFCFVVFLWNKRSQLNVHVWNCEVAV